MGKSAYVKLVKGSTQQEITLEQVKALFDEYIRTSAKLGEQVEWEYEKASFPYDIIEKEEQGTKYFYLKANQQLYNYLMVGVGTETVDGEDQHYIQIVKPDEEYLTPGDQAKANEFSKYFAQNLKAELHMFNGRVLYYNPRK